MNKIQTIILCVFASLLLACGDLNSKQKTSVDESLKALKKIEAATQVEANYSTYKQLLIEAKVEVDEAEKSLPKESKLRTELLMAMFTYENASLIRKMAEENYDDVEGLELKQDALRRLRQLWKDAGEHLKKASELAE